MKKNNKKGFTIVELVIVIAVIAILAAVLIPTFSNVIEKAQKSAAMQAARNEYEMYLAEYAKDLKGTESFYIVSGDYYFVVEAGQFSSEAHDGALPTGAGEVDLSANVIKSAKTGTGESVTAPTVTDEIKDNKWYKAADLKEEISTGWVANTEYFYVVELAKDLGNEDVYIYAK